MTYREAICAAIADELESDPTVVFMGEDVGAAGGSFKTSEGLLSRFGPSRVIDTPICENSFLGVGLGMAVTGMRPVVEIMFSDFLPMAGDSIVNEIPKLRFMSGGQTAVPLTVRASGGATARFGSQHSATAESWFMSVAGLHIVTASSPGAAYGLLRTSIRDNNPVLFIEHKGLYRRRGPVVRGAENLPKVGKALTVRSGFDVTVVATLLMVERALKAADIVAASDGIDVDVIDLRWIAPLDLERVAASVARTGRLVVVEEQPHAGGWGATLVSRLTMDGIAWRSRPAASSLLDAPIAFSPLLEDAALPSVERIAETIRSTAR
jgi:pyruvate dehydrogenase E1 component beta subunit